MGTAYYYTNSWCLTRNGNISASSTSGWFLMQTLEASAAKSTLRFASQWIVSRNNDFSMFQFALAHLDFPEVLCQNWFVRFQPLLLDKLSLRATARFPHHLGIGNVALMKKRWLHFFTFHFTLVHSNWFLSMLLDFFYELSLFL